MAAAATRGVSASVRLLSVAAVLLAVVAGTGCVRSRSVADVQADPEGQYGKRVKIEGTADDAIEVSSFTVYQLDDGTGRIWVVSRGSAPSDGQRVRVVGRVNSPVEIGAVSLDTHVVEDSRDVLKR